AFARSATTTKASLLRGAAVCATSSKGHFRLPISTTFAPFWMKSSLVARPIPLDAPVTITFLPLMFSSITQSPVSKVTLPSLPDQCPARNFGRQDCRLRYVHVVTDARGFARTDLC